MDVDSTITEPGSLGDREGVTASLGGQRGRLLSAWGESGGGRCQSRGKEGEVAASLEGQGGEVAVSLETERKLLPAWGILSLLLGHHELFHDTLPSMIDRNHLKP